ncbi:hypothetical protein [Saccharopolyspora sp. NPDC050642]|uniref:hypothetical protein n=1 Tax=Saccharopolyspora sp. NPDC050642 TaxID=3157099 RepID=UPI0033BFFA8B
MDDPRLDLTDLFAFSAPGDRTVLIMDVHPFAGEGDALHPYLQPWTAVLQHTGG